MYMTVEEYVFCSFFNITVLSQKSRDVRKPNFGSVSILKNPNQSQKVKPEISVSVAFLKTELVSYK